MANAAVVEEGIVFTSEGLRLEGVLAYPEEGEPETAVLLVPPHPHLGGSMENNVIRHVARAAAADGAATLRFNYRGVGRSEIRLPAGRSLFDHWNEMERMLRYHEILPDVRAALDALTAVAPGAACVLMGYSLGAVLAGMLAEEAAVARLAAVGPPVARAGLEPFRRCHKAKLFVAGDRDFTFDANVFERDFVGLPEPKSYVPFPGADHFFRKQEESLYQILKPALFARA